MSSQWQGQCAKAVEYKSVIKDSRTKAEAIKGRNKSRIRQTLFRIYRTKVHSIPRLKANNERKEDVGSE